MLNCYTLFTSLHFTLLYFTLLHFTVTCSELWGAVGGVRRV